MSRFTAEIPFELEFDGDKIIGTLIPLKRRHTILLAPMMRKAVSAQAAEARAQAAAAGAQAAAAGAQAAAAGAPAAMQIDLGEYWQNVETYLPILKECVREIHGLMPAGGGAELTFGEIAEAHYFTPLLDRLMAILFTSGRLEGEIEKKPAAPSSG
jgi:hypothetical protein